MKIKINSSQMEEIEGLHPEYPYTLHRVDLDHTAIPWHWHEELEFDYVAEGEANLHTPAGSYHFFEKEAFFMNTNTLCTVENVRHCKLESHLFDPIFLGGHFKSIFETKYLNPVLQNKNVQIIALKGETENQRKIIEKIRKLGILQEKEDVEFQTRNLLSEIWLLLLEEVRLMENSGIAVRPADQERLLTMLSYIHANYARKLTLDEIARSASVSERECLRCFQSGIQESPFAYLIGWRIGQAKKLLKSTDLSITEVAVETGFSNGAYFSKIFRRECGKTPGTYRRESRL